MFNFLLARLLRRVVSFHVGVANELGGYLTGVWVVGRRVEKLVNGFHGWP